MTDKRASNAKIARNSFFMIIDVLDVKPPKVAATTTQMMKNN